VTPSPTLILASASPRRAELLARLGLDFRISPPTIPEELRPGETPGEHAERLSRAKALQIHAESPHAIVVGGDTVVVLDGKVLGKPAHAAEALGMLQALSGRTHTVFSGLAVAFPDGAVHSGVMSTDVTFRAFDHRFASAYVATGEPMDKAGAYGIQGRGSALIQAVQGDYTTVVGLPVPLLLELLELGGVRYEFGTLLPTFRESAE
jgi:septum formation protein